MHPCATICIIVEKKTNLTKSGVSKGESLLVPKVVNLKFRRFSGIVFGQSSWRALTDFAC